MLMVKSKFSYIKHIKCLQKAKKKNKVQIWKLVLKYFLKIHKQFNKGEFMHYECQHVYMSEIHCRLLIKHQELIRVKLRVAHLADINSRFKMFFRRM